MGLQFPVQSKLNAGKLVSYLADYWNCDSCHYLSNMASFLILKELVLFAVI